MATLMVMSCLRAGNDTTEDKAWGRSFHGNGTSQGPACGIAAICHSCLSRAVAHLAACPPGNVYRPMKPRPKRRTIATLLALAITAAAGSVQAWGDIGHRIVADLAWRQLDPAAKAEVQRL